MNLLPLCRWRQALRSAITPARRFVRILVRHGPRVNASSEEKRPHQPALPNMVLVCLGILFPGSTHSIFIEPRE
jgi:hypothetical protein